MNNFYKQQLVPKMLKAIHALESKAAALAKSEDVVSALRSMKLTEAAKKVEDSIEETLTYRFNTHISRNALERRRKQNHLLSKFQSIAKKLHSA